MSRRRDVSVVRNVEDDFGFWVAEIEDYFDALEFHAGSGVQGHCGMDEIQCAFARRYPMFPVGQKLRGLTAANKDTHDGAIRVFLSNLTLCQLGIKAIGACTELLITGRFANASLSSGFGMWDIVDPEDASHRSHPKQA